MEVYKHRSIHNRNAWCLRIQEIKTKDYFVCMWSCSNFVRLFSLKFILITYIFSLKFLLLCVTISEILECASAPCLNGGRCEELVAGFKCHCTIGYEEKTCDDRLRGVQWIWPTWKKLLEFMIRWACDRISKCFQPSLYHKTSAEFSSWYKFAEISVLVVHMHNPTIIMNDFLAIFPFQNGSIATNLSSGLKRSKTFLARWWTSSKTAGKTFSQLYRTW